MVHSAAALGSIGFHPVRDAQGQARQPGATKRRNGGCPRFFLLK